MSDGPLSEFDLGMMWQVAAAWVNHQSARGSTGTRFLDNALRAYNALDAHSVLHIAARSREPLDLGPEIGWLIGPPIPKTYPPVVPVATILIDRTDAGDEITRFSIRVALLSEREDSTVWAVGWRFELGEAAPNSPNPRQHAQPVVGWTIAGSCLLHPPTNCPDGCRGIEETGDASIDDERCAAASAVDQSHPAFPLATTTMTGLLISCLVSLYGVRFLGELLASEHRLSRAHGVVAEDRDLLLA